jgi:membrane protease YdiL (CAAX protease family)
MDIPGAILRLVAVTLGSIMLSVFAMYSVRMAGVDIKDVGQRNKPIVLVIAMFFNLLFIIFVSLILKFLDNHSLGVLGFTLGSRGTLFAVGTLIFTIVFGFLYVRFLHSRNIIHLSQQSAKPGNPGVRAATILGILVLFVAALQEEVLFRGYFAFILLPYGFWYGILISTVVFTLWHFLTNKAGFYQTTDWLMGGIMLFYIYWISGSIWVAALTHFSRNLTNVLVFDITGTSTLLTYEKPMKPKYKSLYTILLSTLIMLSGYFVFR